MASDTELYRRIDAADHLTGGEKMALQFAVIHGATEINIPEPPDWKEASIERLSREVNLYRLGIANGYRPTDAHRRQYEADRAEWRALVNG